MNDQWCATVVPGPSDLSFNTAMACGGAKPKQGGVVAVACDQGFERVDSSAGAAI